MLLRVLGGKNGFASMVKGEDLVTRRRGPASLDLVLVTEEGHSSLTTTVVEVAASEHAEEGGFSSVLQMEEPKRGGGGRSVVDREGGSLVFEEEGDEERRTETHDVAHDRNSGFEKLLSTVRPTTNEKPQCLRAPPLLRLLIINRTRRRSELDPLVLLQSTVIIERVVEDGDLDRLSGGFLTGGEDGVGLSSREDDGVEGGGGLCVGDVANRGEGSGGKGRRREVKNQLATFTLENTCEESGKSCYVVVGRIGQAVLYEGRKVNIACLDNWKTTKDAP
jgi:hypothetical protein